MARTRLLGVALVVVSFGVLIFAPDGLGYFFAGLALAVSGVPFLLGLVGTPKTVVRARQEAVRSPRAAPLVVPERTFRSNAGPAVLTVLYLLAGFSALLAAAVAVAFWYAGPTAVAGTAAPPAGMAIFLGWYAHRYRGLRVTVGPAGIACRGYLRTVEIPWAEVVALTTRRPLGYFMCFMCDVWSDRTHLQFSAGAIDGSAELMDILSRATGLPWVQV